MVEYLAGGSVRACLKRNSDVLRPALARVKLALDAARVSVCCLHDRPMGVMHEQVTWADCKELVIGAEMGTGGLGIRFYMQFGNSGRTTGPWVIDKEGVTNGSGAAGVGALRSMTWQHICLCWIHQLSY